MANVDTTFNFESGTLLKADTPAGDFDSFAGGGTGEYSIGSSYAKVGDYGLRLYTTNDGWHTIRLENTSDIGPYVDTDIIHISFSLYLPSSEWEHPVDESLELFRLSDSAVSDAFFLYLACPGGSRTEGALFISTRFGGTFGGAYSSVVLSTDTWHHVECVVSRLASGGGSELFLNGTSVASHSDRDLTGNDLESIRIVNRFDPSRTQAVGLYIDCIKIGDDGWIGPPTTGNTKQNVIFIGSNF